VFNNIQTSVSQIDDLSARIPAALSGDGFMKADLKSIEDELTSGNNATLQLKQLNVSNSNGNAIRAVGGGAFEGVYIAAGDTANGITIDGGGTSGNGVSINANDGDGVVITAYGTFPNGIGIYSYGDAFGARFEGGKSIDAPQDIALPSGDLDDQLQAIDNFIDTEVTAIKAKTDQLTFTIANQVDSNVLTGGGSGLDAAGTRAALGLASANLDTQLGDLPTNAELATALGTADDAVLAQVALVKTETDKIASVKAKTDSLTFTTAGQVDANVQSVNDTELTGDGSAVPWGPA
jgi:hypothetical protein